jgi:rod shape-determining protein MreC
MRNLLALLYKYYGVIVFLVLQFFCLSALFNFNTFHRLVYHKLFFQATGKFYSFQNDVTEYITLKEENEALNKENAELRKLVKNSYSDVPNTFYFNNDTLHQQQYEYIPAKIVNSTTTKQHNYFTLNIGSNSGITEGMGVISSNGIVGIISRANEQFSLVLPLLNLRFTASVEVKETGHFGLLKWDGKSPYHIDVLDIAKHAPVEVGHTLITRGSSGIYPAGIEIGTINEAEVELGGNYLNIKTELATNFNKLKHVYVVRNLLKEELKEIQANQE